MSPTSYVDEPYKRGVYIERDLDASPREKILVNAVLLGSVSLRPNLKKGRANKSLTHDLDTLSFGRRTTV